MPPWGQNFAKLTKFLNFLHQNTFMVKFSRKSENLDFWPFWPSKTPKIDLWPPKLHPGGQNFAKMTKFLNFPYQNTFLVKFSWKSENLHFLPFWPSKTPKIYLWPPKMTPWGSKFCQTEQIFELPASKYYSGPIFRQIRENKFSTQKNFFRITLLIRKRIKG